jgi:hypothetical protein
MVTRPAINGGKECPELIQARKGRTGILNVTTT